MPYALLLLQLFSGAVPLQKVTQHSATQVISVQQVPAKENLFKYNTKENDFKNQPKGNIMNSLYVIGNVKIKLSTNSQKSNEKVM